VVAYGILDNHVLHIYENILIIIFYGIHINENIIIYSNSTLKLKVEACGKLEFGRKVFDVIVLMPIE
jgi:hypothetical protein